MKPIGVGYSNFSWKLPLFGLYTPFQNRMRVIWCLYRFMSVVQSYDVMIFLTCRFSHRKAGTEFRFEATKILFATEKFWLFASVQRLEEKESLLMSLYLLLSNAQSYSSHMNCSTLPISLTRSTLSALFYELHFFVGNAWIDWRIILWN